MDQTGQERAVNSFFAAENEKKESFFRKLGRVFAKLLILLVETALLAALVLYAGMYVLAKGPSPAIRKIFVTSVRETSAIGFLADLFFSEEEIAEIEAVKETREYAPTDTTLFTVGDDAPSESGVPQPDEWGLVDEDGDGIIVEQIKGAGYSGYMMVVLDPSRVIVGCVPSSFGGRGFTVGDLAERFEAVAGINAGGFLDEGGMGSGAYPDSLVVFEGEIYFGARGTGRGFVGLDREHRLHVGIRSVQEILDADIQYGVCFGPVLIRDGVMSDPAELASEVNPRSAVGQREDGAILLLVVDGRQAASLGATTQDLADIMADYGAVNACNLDGGSSSLLWYDGAYLNLGPLMRRPRPVPDAFLVLKEGG